MTLIVIFGSTSASIEYKSEKDGAAITTKIIVGMYVQTFSNKVWCAKATRSVLEF